MFQDPTTTYNKEIVGFKRKEKKRNKINLHTFNDTMQIYEDIKLITFALN